MASKPVHPIPDQLGSYRPLARIGRGGTADVYLALDPIGERCAIKLQHRSSARALEGLKREFQLQSWVDCSALVRALDFGVSGDSRGWLALEYIDGVTANSWVGRRDKVKGPPRFERALPLIYQLAWALTVFADRGLVHGDLKPANLMVEPDGTLRVMDMGMARWLGGDWVPEGRFAGTPGFAAPEQLRGEPLTPAADVFGLGATAYTLLRGRAPFKRDRDGHKPEEQPPLIRGLDGLVAELLRSALDPDPELRPTASEIAMGLAAHVDMTPRVQTTGRSRASSSREGLLPSHQQLVAMLAIAGEPVEQQVLADATGADVEDIEQLCRDLQERGLAAEVAWGWKTSEPVPPLEPWTEALAEGLLRGLDPVPSLARAHVLQFLGRLSRAAEETMAVGTVSERLRGVDDPRLDALWRRQCRSADRTLLGPDREGLGLALAPQGDTALARAYVAIRTGEGALAMHLAAEAEREGAPADAVAVARAQAYRLLGRHSTAARVLQRLLQGDLDRFGRCLALLELASVQEDIGRVQLARRLTEAARSTLPERAPVELMGRWTRVRCTVDAALRATLDADAIAAVRRELPDGGDARVLGAFETLARLDDPAPEPREAAIAAATVTGDDAPDQAVAAALSITITGRLPELPDAVADWLGRPGTERWQLRLLMASLELEPSLARQEQAIAVSKRLLARWYSEDQLLFRMNPRFDRDVVGRTS